MKRALLVAGVMTISTAASAGTYLGLGVGTEPALNDEANMIATPSGRSVRALGGYRFGNFSLEAALSGFGVLSGRGESNQYQLSGAGKLSLPINSGFEGYGKLGVERTWLNLNDSRYDMTGNGFLLGGGFEYRFDAGIGAASIWVDYSIHRASLENERKSKVDETLRVWTLGFSVGI